MSVADILGHGHPQNSTAGCEGTIAVALDSGHAGATNLRAVFVASYTDQPEGEEPQTGTDEVQLPPPAPAP